MTPDPETMAQTMNSLAFQSQMNEMLQNPQLIDYIISTNPMLQSLGPQARQLMQSDMFRQIMTNPDVLRQMSRSIGRQMTGASLSPFPEPGVTDTTPGQSSEQQQHDGDQSQALPVNPFLSVLNPYLAAAGMGTPPTYPSGNVDPNSQVPNPATLQNLLRSFANNPPATGPTSSALGQAPHTDNPVLPGQPPQPDQTHNGQPPNLFQPSQMGHPPNPFMAAMMQSMAGRAAGPGTSPGAGMPPTNATMGANPFAGLFRGMPQVPMQAAPSPDTRPPEVMYAEQLGQLNDMGFYDFENNVRALVRSGGSVQGAVHQLLQSNENSR
jgi:ubiquilin